MRIITGKFKGTRLESVDHTYLKPIDDRVKEALFNILMPCVEGAKVLDLFAGTGAIGIEALSRGAKHVSFVEKDRAFQLLLKKNLGKIQAEDQAEILREDVFTILPILDKKGERFDLIFVDPPYFDQVQVLKEGKFKQTRGIRKPKGPELIQNLQSSEGEDLPRFILKYIDRFRILKDSGLLVLRSFKKVPLETETLASLTCFRQERYGDAVVSFFKVK